MRKITWFICIVGCLSWAHKSTAQEEKYIGLYIYNITKYFDWPPSMKSGSFVIEVFGHKSVYTELQKLTTGKSFGTQNIVVRNYSSIDQIGDCHIIFVGYWQSRYFDQVVSRIGSKPTLIITEYDGLLKKGSAINFVIRNNKIEFELKPSNATSHGLKMDPRIRQLAFNVVD